jgi:hypothetical protein
MDEHESLIDELRGLVKDSKDVRCVVIRNYILECLRAIASRGDTTAWLPEYGFICAMKGQGTPFAIDMVATREESQHIIGFLTAEGFNITYYAIGAPGVPGYNRPGWIISWA